MKFAVAAAGLLTSVQANAQEVFNKGTNTVSLLVGFWDNTYGQGQKMLVPPLQLAYEHGIVDGLIDGNASIGVGVAGGYAASKLATTVVDTKSIMTYNHGFVGARGSFHYQFINKLDTYAGVFLGCSMSKASLKNEIVNKVYSENKAVEANFGWAGFLGARYYFIPSMAINAEIGYGISIFNIGLTFRF